MRALLVRGLAGTAGQWTELQTIYGWVHHAAAILENHAGLDGAGVRLQDDDLVAEMVAGHKMLAILAG